MFSLIDILFLLHQESEKQIAVDVTQLDIPAELALVFANIQGKNEKVKKNHDGNGNGNATNQGFDWLKEEK